MAYCGTTRYKPATEWEFANKGHVPDAAVSGGEDCGETIYIARATHRGNIIPGKLLPSHGCVYIPWRGEEYAYRNYQPSYTTGVTPIKLTKIVTLHEHTGMTRREIVDTCIYLSTVSRVIEAKVLVNNCGALLEWKPVWKGGIHTGAIQGGITSDGERLYIGRTWHEGTLAVGKVHPSHGVLYIAYDGKEISYPNYEILVLKYVNF